MDIIKVTMVLLLNTAMTGVKVRKESMVIENMYHSGTTPSGYAAQISNAELLLVIGPDVMESVEIIEPVTVTEPIAAVESMIAQVSESVDMVTTKDMINETNPSSTLSSYTYLIF